AVLIGGAGLFTRLLRLLGLLLSRLLLGLVLGSLRLLATLALGLGLLLVLRPFGLEAGLGLLLVLGAGLFAGGELLLTPFRLLGLLALGLFGAGVLLGLLPAALLEGLAAAVVVTGASVVFGVALLDRGVPLSLRLLVLGAGLQLGVAALELHPALQVVALRPLGPAPVLADRRLGL